MISHTAKITIVGLGLLGGSYAKGFFQAGYPVYGIDIDENAVEYARKMHWVKDASTDPAFCEGSDIIISALYPHTFIQWVKENQAYFKPGTVLTDVTGMKLPSCPQWLLEIPDYNLEESEPQQAPARKLIINGQFIIRREEADYDIYGQRVN